MVAWLVVNHAGTRPGVRLEPGRPAILVEFPLRTPRTVLPREPSTAPRLVRPKSTTARAGSAGWISSIFPLKVLDGLQRIVAVAHDRNPAHRLRALLVERGLAGNAGPTLTCATFLT